MPGPYSYHPNFDRPEFGGKPRPPETPEEKEARMKRLEKALTQNERWTFWAFAAIVIAFAAMYFFR